MTHDDHVDRRQLGVAPRLAHRRPRQLRPVRLDLLVVRRHHDVLLQHQHVVDHLTVLLVRQHRRQRLRLTAPHSPHHRHQRQLRVLHPTQTVQDLHRRTHLARPVSHATHTRLPRSLQRQHDRVRLQRAQPTRRHHVVQALHRRRREAHHRERLHVALRLTPLTHAHVTHEVRPEVLDGVELVAVALQVVLVHGAHHVQTALLQHVAEVDQRVRVGRRRVQQHGRSPVLRVVLVRVQLQQQLPHLVVDQRLRDVAPLLSRRREQQVQEDHHHHRHRDHRLPTPHAPRLHPHPVDVEHDQTAQHRARQRHLPRARLEPRAVVGRARDAQHERRQVHERVGETEEVGHDGGDGLWVTPPTRPHAQPADEHATLTQHVHQQNRHARLVALPEASSETAQEGEHVVARQRLEHTRTTDEGAQRRGEAHDHDAHQRDVGRVRDVLEHGEVMEQRVVRERQRRQREQQRVVRQRRQHRDDRASTQVASSLSLTLTTPTRILQVSRQIRALHDARHRGKDHRKHLLH